MAEPYDLAIIGGGPAGQAAAEQACAAGLRVAIVDEQPLMGGQILRQPPAAIRVAKWMAARTYRALRAQLARTEARPDLTFHGGMSVLGLFPAVHGHDLMCVGPEGRMTLSARRVLVAAGCYDMPVAFPGWTLPGVSSAGAVQAFVKSQQLVPGDRFLFVGTHPLQLLVADQVRRAGGTVAALCFAQPLSGAMARVLRDPLTALRQPGPLADAAAAWLRLRRAGIPVRFGTGIIAATGEDGVAQAVLSDGGRIDCDRIATCYGFLPQSDLPRQIGCRTERDAATGGWATVADAWMRSTVDGVYVAGETSGVAGAEIAMREGRLAGIAIAADAGRIDDAAAESRARPVRAELARLRGFARLLADVACPTGHLPAMTDATILCRCEDVTRGAILSALRAVAGPGAPSAVKLTTRAGMGVCQGRSCEHAVMALIAAETGLAPGSGFTARFPARPVAIGDLIDEG
jgi:thioredoxin reductase